MKEKFVKSTLILLVGGGITKILGLIIKMVMGRMVGTEVLGLYMLILPTFSLFIGLSQFGLPIALSKMVAEDKKNNKRLFFSIIPVSLFINVLLIVTIWIFAPLLSIKLLHNPNSYYAILAIGLVIPFTSISSICRSYFFGKEKMIPHVISNVVEDLARLIVMFLGIPFFINKGSSYLVTFLILINIVSEVASILVLFLFLPKKFSITKTDLKPSRSYIRESLSIGIPNTTGRLVGSIGYFLEPIILTGVLVNMGYSSSYITREYGILSGYVMPILLLPSFFTMAISNALLPIVSKDYSNKKYDNVKNKIILACLISLIIGGFFTGITLLIPELLLRTIYHTSQGVNYMRFLAPVCFFQYLQAPLSFSLEAMGKSHDVMFASILGMSIRTILLICLSMLKIGIWGVIIAISINVLVVTFYDLFKVKKALSY